MSTVGVRWQQQMEDHLAIVREANTMLRQGKALPPARALVYATAAQANATAALALAMANGVGDLELALMKLGKAMAVAE